MKLSAKLKHLVERELDFIVQLAEEGVQKGEAASRTEESQFRNLQNIASVTDSTMVLKNFIGYQIGRKYIDEKVGRQILEDIKTLEQRAAQIAEKEGFKESAEFRTFRMELVRLYLGFFVRALKAAKA